MRTYAELSKALGNIVREFARAARVECEMMKSDPDFFRNWPEFVTIKEQIKAFNVGATQCRYQRARSRSVTARLPPPQ